MRLLRVTIRHRAVLQVVLQSLMCPCRAVKSGTSNERRHYL